MVLKLVWEDTVKQNNIGRFLGTDSQKVILIKEDIEQNGILPSQPPVYIDIDTGDITGGHRHEFYAWHPWLYVCFCSLW